MADSTSETSLKQIIQNMTGGECTVYQGTVTSASPLKIQIANDEKLIITESNTYVPMHMTNYTTTCTISWTTGSTSGGSDEEAFASHSHSVSGTKSITINNALAVGDTVHVLSFAHGKQYFVLDKVV